MSAGGNNQTSLGKPVLRNLFLLFRLPSAFFSGVRIRTIDERSCTVTVPFNWFTKNPFRSTYFACLAMAAEMSTGALALLHVRRQKRPVSMLVLAVESAFQKKATGRTTFTCIDGTRIEESIANAIASGNPNVIRARSVGVDKAGTVIAEFYITWSFKARN